MRHPRLIDEIAKREWEFIANGQDMGRIHHAGLAIDEDDGRLIVYASCAAENAKGVAEIVTEQLDALARHGPTPAEIARAKAVAGAQLLMGMEWAARRFYSIPSIIERMARSKTGLWWNIARNLGYHLALRNFGHVGFDPSGHPLQPPLPRRPSATNTP